MGSVSLEWYARDYVDRLVKPSRETRRKYLERLSRYVFPDLGDRPLTAVTRRSMREWQQGMLAGGLSAKTIANVRGEVLYPMFEASCLPGEDDEPALRTYNPLRGLPLPDRDSVERDVLETVEEAVLFLGCAYDVDPDAAELILTALASGMRWGELAGLPVRAVHPGRGVVAVEPATLRPHDRQHRPDHRPLAALVHLAPSTPGQRQDQPLPPPRKTHPSTDIYITTPGCRTSTPCARRVGFRAGAHVQVKQCSPARMAHLSAVQRGTS